MANAKFREIDQEKMLALLDKHPDDAAGLLLALAWRAGLKSDELVALKWEQVDFEDRCIRIRDRTVKLEDKLLARLQMEKERHKNNEYVVVFPDSDKPLSRATGSRFLRKCLNNGGFPDITVTDLRHDYAERTLCANGGEGWRSSGMTAYEAKRMLGEQKWEQLVGKQTQDEISEVLGRVLEKNRDNWTGIALWLLKKENMGAEDVANLTWEQIDLERSLIHLDSGDVKVSPEIIELLRGEEERQKPVDDQHVILSKIANKPMTSDALISSVNALLKRNGLPPMDGAPQTLKERIRCEREQILQYGRQNGAISVEAVKSLLKCKPFVAYSRINDLVDAGLLLRSGRKYYLAGQVVPKEQWDKAVIRYLESHETATEKGIAELLHISAAASERLLRNMVSSGKLVMIRQGKKYLLPRKPT